MSATPDGSLIINAAPSGNEIFPAWSGNTPVAFSLNNMATTVSGAISDSLERTNRANAILRAAERGPVAGTATAVTVANGGNTSALMGINYDAGVPFTSSTYFQNVGAPYKVGNAGMQFNNGGVAFSCYAPEFEFWCRAGKWELWINGVQADTSPYTSSGDGLKRVTLPSIAQRTVELRFTKAVSNMAGVIVRKAYTIEPVRPTWLGPIVGVLGDSYDDAIGTSNLVNPGDGYVMKLGRLTNWDTYAVGYGGEGYTTSPGMIDRAANLPTNADLVFICAGINDNSSTAAIVGPAALLTFQTVRARCPNAFIVVVGPWRAPGRTPAQSISDAIKAAQATFALTDGTMTTFFDTYADNLQNGAGLGFGGFQQQGDVTFTAPLVAATSGTLTAPWAGSTGSYTVVFYVDVANGSVTKTATLTNGSAAVSWSGAVTSTATAYVYRSTAGNSDLFLIDDSIHPAGNVYVAPSNDGHANMARYLRNKAVAWFRTLI